MKYLKILLFGFVLFSITACAPSIPESTATVGSTYTQTLTATVSLTPTPTSTLTPTATPTPSPTPFPTATPTPVPIFEYSTEAVSITTEDDIEIQGTLFLSEGNTAVVFAHMAGGDNDQQNWIPFAKQIARRGFTALTFDFRCYGESGCGGSGSGSVLLSRDVGAAIDFLRKQGFERIICIGASMGGRACVTVAFDKELDGIIIVSGTGSGDPDRQNLNDFVNPEMSKLFIVSKNDHIPDRTNAMILLHDGAPEPKIFKTFPGIAHGTELFSTQYGGELRELIFEFLEEIRSSE